MKSFRLLLARKLFELSLWKLGGFVLPRRGDDRLFHDNGRLETRKGTQVE